VVKLAAAIDAAGNRSMSQGEIINNIPKQETRAITRLSLARTSRLR